MKPRFNTTISNLSQTTLKHLITYIPFQIFIQSKVIKLFFSPVDFLSTIVII